MSYKIVTDADGIITAAGPNCEEFQPAVAEGSALEIVEDLPVIPIPNPRIAEIKAELTSLDFKRIRPIAEGDTEYLAELNTQVLALRAELKLLTTPADIEANEESITQAPAAEPAAEPTSEEI